MPNWTRDDGTSDFGSSTSCGCVLHSDRENEYCPQHGGRGDNPIPVDITPVDVVLSNRFRGGCTPLELKLQEDAAALEYIIQRAKDDGVKDPEIEMLFTQMARHMRRAALALVALQHR